MSAGLMEPDIAAAIDAGRPVIVPSAQRAAALRWNWARSQLAAGHTVWQTPQILPWDAWLDAQWDKARLAGRVPSSTRRLNRSQQLKVWQRVLVSLEAVFVDAGDLAQHAAALMDSAARATQWLLPLSRLAVTDEERLLADALAGVREWCSRHDCVALPVCTAAQLVQIVAGPAPLIAGQRSLTVLQLALGEQCWPGAALLHEPSLHESMPPRQVVAADPDEEIRACARWCREQLEIDPARRLLVISVASNPSPAALSTLLARELCAGTGVVPEEMLEQGLLAVEGGAMLSHQQLIADALAALRLLREPMAVEDLARVLGSPYLRWGDAAQMLALRGALAESGFAQWTLERLLAALSRQDAAPATAGALAAWLAEGRQWQGSAPRVEWARRFSQWLGAARFGRADSLDSRDAQRLQRWNELLDEFAALDGISEPLPPDAALEELLQLTERARHAARSGDAAITLTTQRGAPLARHDGIWVLGLAEQRWPEPPRPDPYVPLSEQRRCGWDESSARHRLEQARWSLRQWQASTPGLVLSYPRLEGDVHHRPSALPGLEGAQQWEVVVDAPQSVDPFNACAAVPASDLAPMQVAADSPLRRGQQRLRAQQDCAFRAQAEIRLGAVQLPVATDGITPVVRGMLLHAVLDGLWRDLGDQRALAALPTEGRRALVARHWARQVAQLSAEGRLPPGQRLLERERLRSERLLLRVLEMEATRPYFRVVAGERQLQLATFAGEMSLRVDRLDEDGHGRHWLIDYKSGQADVFRLNKGEAQPLQLVLYEQALAAQGVNVQGMALLSLAPSKTGYRAAAPEPGWDDASWQRIPDWEVQREHWRGQIDTLLHEHVAGVAHVAPLRDACRRCHLEILCRRAEPDTDTDDDAEDVPDGAESGNE